MMKLRSIMSEPFPLSLWNDNMDKLTEKQSPGCKSVHPFIIGYVAVFEINKSQSS